MASIPWPAENAKLLDARGPGAQDDYGNVATAAELAAAAVWTGSIGAVLKRERRIDETTQVLSTVEDDVLVVRKPPAAIANLTPGDQQSAHTVLIEDRRVSPYVQKRWRVVDVSNRARGKESDSLRLVLADSR